ncbi:MAG: hypothetical protein Q4F11_08020, partial [Eubacteriales bacterium]|nr:hypothetical protein [Eubacteriales bacterium]
FMAAEQLLKGDYFIENDDTTEEEYVLKREIETLMDNARYSDEYRQLAEIDDLKEKGRVAECSQAVDEMFNRWRSDYMKYTS